MSQLENGDFDRLEPIQVQAQEARPTIPAVRTAQPPVRNAPEMQQPRPSTRPLPLPLPQQMPQPPPLPLPQLWRPSRIPADTSISYWISEGIPLTADRIKQYQLFNSKQPTQFGQAFRSSAAVPTHPPLPPQPTQTQAQSMPVLLQSRLPIIDKPTASSRQSGYAETQSQQATTRQEPGSNPQPNPNQNPNQNQNPNPNQNPNGLSDMFSFEG